MTERKVQLALNLTFTKEEFSRIRKGLVPDSMEDKWFIYVEDGHIYFHRSWTGIMMYDCLFKEREDDVVVSSMYVNRNPSHCRLISNRYDIALVTSFLRKLSK